MSTHSNETMQDATPSEEQAQVQAQTQTQGRSTSGYSNTLDRLFKSTTFCSTKCGRIAAKGGDKCSTCKYRASTTVIRYVFLNLFFQLFILI